LSCFAVARIDLNVKDTYERTALHWACEGGHGDIVRLLLSSFALDSCQDVHGLTALHYCIQSKSTPSVEAFVGSSEMTHLPNNEGRTPLMEAAASGYHEAVQLLLQNRLVVKGINQKDPEGMTSMLPNRFTSIILPYKDNIEQLL